MYADTIVYGQCYKAVVSVHESVSTSVSLLLVLTPVQ